MEPVRVAVWLDAFVEGQASEAGVDVPCGTCTACCRSSMFVHVEPDEPAARRVPAALLFPAPGRRDGTKVLPFDAEGRCPMLVDGACSIYDDRPRACRRFDCRVYAATDVVPDQALVAEASSRWRFLDDGDLARLRGVAVTVTTGPPPARALAAVARHLDGV